MRPPIDDRRPWIVGGLLLLCLVAAEAWWHRVPTLKRVKPETYYTILVGEAGEARDHGDFHRAESLLSTAIREFPRWYWAYSSLGDTFLKAGNTNAALTNYTMAIKFCGTSPTNLLSAKGQIAERTRIVARIRSLEVTNE